MDYTLPQVVLCKTPMLRTSNDAPSPVNLEQPILLADQRTARHLLARIVNHDDRNNTFYESLDSVVIPEDYDGHFLRLQSRTTKDKSHVQSLDAIAHDDTPAFLNLSNITSFPAGRDPRGHSKFIYTVGNVFLVDEPPPESAAKAGSGDKSASQSAVSGASSRRSANGLMRCLDERGKVIMVPTNQVGEMVTIQKGPNGSSKLSVMSSEMIAGAKFPLVARFAYAKRRPRLTGFSRLFTLLDSFQETSLVACILDGSAIITLLEIPVSSSLQFQVALNRDDLLAHPRLHNALEVCRGQRGQEFARDIKFKYKFSHRVQETSRRMMKLKEDDLLSATVRTRLVVTETYIYI